MKSARRFSVLGILLAASALSSAAVAQEAAQPAAPAAEAPKPVAKATSEDDFLQQMVRDHRDGRRRRSRNSLQQALSDAGFGEGPVQEAVLKFADAQEASREEVRQAAGRCAEAVRNPKLDDAQVSLLLEDLQAATTLALAKREEALAELDKAVRYKANPRLQILLRLAGLLGSEAWFVADAPLDLAESFDLRVLYPAAAQ